MFTAPVLLATALLGPARPDGPPAFAGKWENTRKPAGLISLTVAPAGRQWRVAQVVAGPTDAPEPGGAGRLHLVRNDDADRRPDRPELFGFAVLDTNRGTEYLTVHLEGDKLVAEVVHLTKTPGSDNRRWREVLERVRP